MPMPPIAILEPIVRNALEEDLSAGDVTSAACLSSDQTMKVAMRARQAGILAGLEAAILSFRLTDPSLTIRREAACASHIEPGDALLNVEGSARSILMAERTALNFVTHLSGIASLTARYVQAVSGTQAKIAPTRKTLPGLRSLQKAAVEAGGGSPHRFALGDAVLIKDNHIAAAGDVSIAIRNARAAAGHMRVISVEVDTLDQLDEALRENPDVILLDNFSLEDLREAVRRNGGAATLEASGGVNLETVGDIAGTGIDVISVGALTHSAPALDIGLDAA